MDKFKIDSHKLAYHVSRVHDWMRGERIYPIYAEISPTGACNHRCVYCGLDFMDYRPRQLDTGLLKTRLSEMSKLGVKSVMFAGEGEPFLHKDMTRLVRCAKDAGLSAAVTTNGVLFGKEDAEGVLEAADWVKASVDAAMPQTYAKIHGADPGDLDRVIENMSYAAKVRDRNGYDCALGIQLLLLPENRGEVTALARRAREIGMDYFVVKPYSQHPQSRTRQYDSVRYADGDEQRLTEELETLKTAKFDIIFRKRAMEKWDEGTRTYEHCRALPFWSYIDAGGEVWGCSVYLGDERFLYGNINDNTFQEIWEGEKRQRSLQWVENDLDAAKCRVNCRMDEINRYLWEIKNPPKHVNFI